MQTKPRKVVVLFVMLALLVTMSLQSIPKIIAAEEINDLSNEIVETVLQETPAEIQPEEAMQNGPDSESDLEPLSDTTPIVSETEEEPGGSPTIPNISEEDPFREAEPVHILENADLELFNEPLPPRRSGTG